MSPTLSVSPIYDHLMINAHEQPKISMRNATNSSIPTRNFNQSGLLNTQSSGDHLFNTEHRKSIPPDVQSQPKRRYTITHTTISEPIIRCSVSNQVYDMPLWCKTSTFSDTSATSYEMNPNEIYKQNTNYGGLSSSSQTSSPHSSNSRIPPTDFRPLIINARRRLTMIPSASPPMIIVKKTSPFSNYRSISEQVNNFQHICLFFFLFYFGILEAIGSFSSSQYN